MKRLRREWRAELFIIKPVCKTTTANCKTWQICSWSEKIMNLRKSFFMFFKCQKRAKISHQPRLPPRLLRVSSCVYSLCLFRLSSYTRLYLHTFTPLLNVTPWVYTVPLSFHPSICQEDCGLNFRESHERWVGFRRVSPLEWANLNKKGLRKCQEIHLQRDGGGKRDCKTLEVMTVNVVRRCETVDSGTSFVFSFFLETSPPALFGSACWKHAAAAASSGDLFKALPAADAVLQVKHAGCCDNKCRPVTTIKLTHPESPWLQEQLYRAVD